MVPAVAAHGCVLLLYCAWCMGRAIGLPLCCVCALLQHNIWLPGLYTIHQVSIELVGLFLAAAAAAAQPLLEWVAGHVTCLCLLAQAIGGKLNAAMLVYVRLQVSVSGLARAPVDT